MKKIMLDQMILTTCCPTNAGSKMLESYTSPFNATVVDSLRTAGYEICGKAPVGEFAIDLAGESSFAGETSAAAIEALKSNTVGGLISLDVNGAPRRIAAQNGLVFLKPTYGIVSRFGTVPVACSGECVGVMASNAADCREIISVIAGKDERDGTMHADEICKNAVCSTQKPIRRVAVLNMEADADVTTAIRDAKEKMAANGIEICEIDVGAIACSNAAWNMLMCAELCNNVSRYDGIKYGYRTQNYQSLDELYTGSRTEAFGALLKTAILYGSDVLSTKNYTAKYDKALRVRRVIVEAFAEIFAAYDAVLLPACSKLHYTDADNTFIENRYTAPASITGLPAVVAAGVQLIAPAFSDGALLELAALLCKEGK